MPASPPNWRTEVFENALDGVSSAVTPELIQPTQIAWGINTANRGAKPGTRPALKYRMSLPSGLVQGVSFFGVQGGMGVAQIEGRLYRLRINPASYAVEYIPLPWRNSAIIKQVYMQQTVESLVIQDGQSDPIIYNGSTAVRSVPSEGGVPRGKQMAYGNGRLWVAINEKELVAGDIRTGAIGSELLFTETNYLSGGGKLFFPRGITGLAFIATTGTSDYGALLVFGADYCESIRADITFRDLWAQTPGFVTNVLRHTGCASEWSLVEVNQDLYWRDSGGGLRSIRSALADESGPGNSPISREVSRLTDYDSPQLLPFCSAISFNNRLICTSSPRLNDRGGVTWRDLIPLDFAPISTMRGKTLPAYDGQWQGINFTHLFQGQFINKSRAFAISADDNGANSLWEILPDGPGETVDVYSGCTDGSGVAEVEAIRCIVEHGRRSFGDPTKRKRLERCDVYLSDMEGEVNLSVYWRSDNNQKWQQWDDQPVEVCANTGDPEVPGETVHVWKNLLPQQRPQIKTFTIPSDIDDITRYSLATGFEFQVRLVWTGKTKIYKTVLHSTFLDDPAWALRDVLSASCSDNNVTGNEIIYSIPSSPCPVSCSLELTRQPESVNLIFLGDQALEYRGAQGTASLIGFSEFADPSVPPKKYRRLDQANSQTATSFNGAICGGDPVQTETCTLSGQGTYDAITGAYSQSGSNNCGPVVLGPFSDSCGIVAITGKTSSSQFRDGAPCCPRDFGATSFFYDSVSGTVLLSIEDLEADAIFRFLIANPYGAWGPTQLDAVYEARTDFTFGYATSEFRLQLTGFSPGAEIWVDIPIYQRFYGTSDPFVLLQVLEFSETADGSGNATVTGAIVNLRGYETRAGAATVFFIE